PRMPGGGMHFPIFEDTREALKLFFGINADIFRFHLPRLAARAEARVPFRFGLFEMSLGGNVDVEANLKFGFDTAGFATGNLLDGFFLDFRDGRPLFRFEGELRAEARLGASFQVPELGVDVTLAGAGAYWRHNLRLTPRTEPDG